MNISRTLATALCAAALLVNGLTACAQAPVATVVGTRDYVVTVKQPAYANGAGPRILIDEAHHNYQTMADRFKGFADLMRADGARVAPLRERLSASALANADILVICNALNEANVTVDKAANKWVLPAPSAFGDDEIAALAEWVKNGGSLLLIADHMPFPSAAEKLADALGVVMQSNFAFDAAFTYQPKDMNLITFHRAPPSPATGILHAHPVVAGARAAEQVPFVISFTGHAFRVKPGVLHTPILELGDGSKLAWPSNYIDISLKTPFSAGVGSLQGAVLPHGYGRVAVFGEASMFSVNFAEWAGNYPTGFHNPAAPHNQQFVLNVMHWLAKRL